MAGCSLSLPMRKATTLSHLVLWLLPGTAVSVTPELMRATNHMFSLVKPWHDQANVSGLSNVKLGVDGKTRRYVLGVPSNYAQVADEGPLPLWLLGPGGESTPERFIAMTSMHHFIERNPIIFAGLEGWWRSLNTEGEGGKLPNDLNYVRAVISDISQKVKIDPARIRCLGYSRGARFCSMLTSKLSAYISSIGVVGGIIFPEPMLSKHKVPIVAFHGTSDPVNLFWGAKPGTRANGWSTSVPVTIGRWAKFNGCTREVSHSVGKEVVVHLHTDCTDNAEVMLVAVKGGGHTWPGAWTNDNFGLVTQDINANEAIFNFTLDKSMACQEPEEGDTCSKAIDLARQKPCCGMDQSSPSWEFQEHLRSHAAGDCMPACTPDLRTNTSTTTTTSTATSTSTVWPPRLDAIMMSAAHTAVGNLSPPLPFLGGLLSVLMVAFLVGCLILRHKGIHRDLKVETTESLGLLDRASDRGSEPGTSPGRSADSPAV